jgi:succinoglycan biosynthesis transport protein ExoP
MRALQNSSGGDRPDRGIIRADDFSTVPDRSDYSRSMAHDTGELHDDFLATCLQVLRRRKWTVVGFFVVVVGLVAMASVLMEPKYNAIARIVFYRENSDVLGFKDLRSALPEDSDYSVSLDTQVRILQSDTLALQVIGALRLDQNPSFTGESTEVRTQARSGPTVAWENDPQRRQAMLERFHNQLSVYKDKNTRVIEINYKSKSPQLAARIANALARGYIEHNFKTKYESTMQTSDWLTQQLDGLQSKVEISQQKLVAYQKEHGILGIDDKQNVITARLDDLNRELTAAQSDRIQKETAYRLTLSENAELIGKEEPDGLMGKLRAQQAQLKTQYAQATIQLGPSNPKVLEIGNQLKETAAQIKAEVDNISKRIRNQHSMALAREHMILTALEQQKQAANQLNESAIEYGRLKRDVESNRQLYEGLLQKLREAGVSAGLRSSNIQIVDVAQVPAEPSEPSIPRNLAAAIMLGLIGGVGLAFVQEKLDRTVRTTRQLRVLSTLPSFGVIPLDSPRTVNRVAGKQGLRGNGSTSPHSSGETGSENLFIRKGTKPFETIVTWDPMSMVAESYRTVLNTILLSGTVPPRTILVTSAISQEGKTATSINLAIILTRQGKQVLLVDADLRKSGIQKVMRLSPTRGLSTLLNSRLHSDRETQANTLSTSRAARIKAMASKIRAKGIDLTSVLGDETLSASDSAASVTSESVILPVPEVPNLFVLPAGSSDEVQCELTSLALMQKLMMEWRGKFDHVIIDTPPVLLAADAVRLSVEADSIILVVRSGYTTQEAFCRAQELLLQVNAPATGILLNAVDLRSPDLSYYREYGQDMDSRSGSTGPSKPS